jgi:hypothetical protein
MAENKTVVTRASVTDYLKAVDDEGRRKDCKEVVKMMKAITGEPARMWGPSIVGFGSYHYKYDSSREGDFLITGFSSRKGSLTLYIMPGFSKYDKLMKKLGKYKTGKSCLYIKTLDDIDRDVLLELITESVSYMKKKYK